MCWGIEAEDGWYKPLNELCSYLETLNNTFYPKYRIRIQADQVKEKYGELRFYYSIIADPNFFLKSIMNIAHFIDDKINRYANFQKEKKIISPAVKKKIKSEINEEVYEKNKDNANFIKENDKFYQLIDCYEPEQFEYVSKNHKLLYKIDKLFYHIHFDIKYNVKVNEKQKKIGNMLAKISDSLIEKYEDECWNVCEWCGADGGFQGENMVTTSGWISRICKECYKKSMDKHNQKTAEQNNTEYKPVILSFQYAYDYLNAYHYDYFKYNDKSYGSVAEAFYCEKENGKYKKIFETVFKGSKKEYIEKMSNEIFKLLKLKINKKDIQLLKDIIKTKFSIESNKKLLMDVKDYELHHEIDDHNILWGECGCNKCKKLKNNGLYIKLLEEVKKEMQ